MIAFSILEAKVLAMIRGGFQVSDLKKGTMLSVLTRNSIYRIVVIDPKEGTVVLDGGRLSGPRTIRINGSTFGGSIIKIGWIGAGMFLEFQGGFHTSEVQSVRLQNNPKLARRIVEEARVSEERPKNK